MLARCVAWHLEPNTAAYNALIDACAGRWDMALQVFLLASKRDVITYNATIRACAAGFAWQEALCILRLLQSTQLQCDVVASDLLIEEMLRSSASIAPWLPATSCGKLHSAY